jgi:excisionase family DNA binding protein
MTFLIALFWLVLSTIHDTRARALTLADLVGPEAPVVISVEDAGQLLHLGRGSTYEGVRRGEIPALHVGARWLVPVGPFLKFVGAAQPEPTRAAS